MPPRKKRASVAEGDDADDVYDPKKASKSGENDGDAEKPRKKSRAKKEKESEEVHTAHEGPAWTVVPPSLLYRCYSNYLREWVGKALPTSQHALYIRQITSHENSVNHS